MVYKKLMIAGICAILILTGFRDTHGAPSAALFQIIEGAKKEGTVRIMLRAGFTQKNMDRLRKEIRQKFGVDLNIQFSPTNNMPTNLSQAIMEYKVGAPPTYDLMTFSNQVVEGMEAGVFERVDWKPLLIEGTNPEVVMDKPETRGAIIYYNGHTGLMYNPQRVTPDKVPKIFKELADPQWKGRIGIFSHTNSWARIAFVLGKEKTLSSLREIMKNGAIVGLYPDLYNRYLLGEIPLCLTTSAYLKMAQDKGVPAAWQSVEFASISNFSLSVRKGTKYPNAAKLVALYLASPEGAKFTFEESLAGNLYYPGNIEHDIGMQDKKQGIREVIPEKDQKMIKFERSEEFGQWQKEIKLILDSKGDL